MKKSILLYSFLFIVVLNSCKDEDEDPTFKKEAFIGTWHRTSTTVEDDCTVSSEDLEFKQSEVSITSVCDGIEISYDADYTFDNKRTINLEIFGISGKFVILELTSTTLKADLYQGSAKQGTSTYQKQ